MPSGTFRFVPNPRMFAELARDPAMGRMLLDTAQRGAATVRVIGPAYTGPTYRPAVNRNDDYTTSVYSDSHLHPNGWRAEFGADAPWTPQVEFGTGKKPTQKKPKPKKNAAKELAKTSLIKHPGKAKLTKADLTKADLTKKPGKNKLVKKKLARDPGKKKLAKTKARRGRPQGGYSPKFRPLGRALDSLRNSR
ncbi:hypothetical protein [Streptomyces hirsutus]|uniref:hypothetical protein n=1 Tax=Streptomyces hirsutus TaxID=35620 RepID=UPI00367A886C